MILAETDTPVVDVLLPVFNGEATIAESVDSLLAQTERRIRVLVVDDGSTDDTPNILAALAQRDGRVIVTRIENSGVVAALNLALSMATAPFVARQDADDISSPDRIAKQIEFLSQNPDVVAVSGSCVHIDADGAPTGTRYEQPDPAAADYDAFPSVEPYLLHPFLTARRDALLAVGGYRYVVHSEDTDLYWRLREQGRLANTSESCGKMRLHESSVSNASVVNGRIMAIMSQLAAVSAKRRAEGRPDLDFPASARADYKNARSLDAMLDLACRPLSGEEAAYLRRAACVKLLELATARAYEVEPEDCAVIRRAYRAAPSEMLRGATVAGWAYRSTLARFVKKAQFTRLLAFLDVSTASRAILLRFARPATQAG